MRSSLVCSLVLSLAACEGNATSGIDGGGPGQDGGGGPDGGGTGDGGGGESFRLIASSFTLGPDGDEKWQCERKTLTEDVWISRFTPIAPTGTHHTLLAIDNDPDADGTTDCGVSIQTDWTVLFASGLGSPELNMPEGVAVHLTAGTQIVLDLHLYNFGSTALSETSAIDVLSADPATIHDEAEVILVGQPSFSFSTMGYPTLDFSCNTNGQTNFFAVFPHMHQMGFHAKVDLTISGVTQTVYDEPYDFEQQWFREYDPIAMNSGDTIKITCTWYNPDGRTVNFGESSDQEMCFAISYRYPPRGGSFGPFCF